MNDQTEKAILTSVWLFKAFARGVASRDVRDKRMSEESSKLWIENSVKEFEKNLRESVDD